MFSATMPKEIAELAGQMLKNPQKVAVTPEASTCERVEQRVIHLDHGAKLQILADTLRAETIDRALVFTRTKHGADKVVRGLVKSGISAEAIHGNKSQGQRERVLAAFRDGRVRTLVATDIAARGIDVDGVSHVINYDLPNIPESYVHRIGRTARAGAAGIAISFCSSEEAGFLRDIEKLIRMSIPATDKRANPRPFNRPDAAHAAPNGDRKSRNNRRRQRPPYPGNAGNGQHRPQRQGRGNGDSRPQTPHHGEIASVAFLRRDSEQHPVKSPADATRAPR
jgi:superfamily II DNA/RNA helicase